MNKTSIYLVWFNLPPISCIYTIKTIWGEVLYVGKTNNLKNRFLWDRGVGHHRWWQIASTHPTAYVEWVKTSPSTLTQRESGTIKRLKPVYNQTSIITEPKLFKLFPFVIRSGIAFVFSFLRYLSK